MTNHEFVEGVRRIAATNPTYRTGGDGSDGTCDCIGLIIGALGKKYPLHSSNYFARYQMEMLDSLQDESQLHVGALVYKSRRDTGKLNARYQPGGSHHAGDPLDYYHVGVVNKIDPLEIMHCTSTDSINGIAYDNSIRAWSYFGDLLDVTITNEEAYTNATIMEVYAENSKPVNVRKRPDVNSAKVGEIAVGELVTVMEQADGWAKISNATGNGYMMIKFLREPSENDGKTANETEIQTVNIALPQNIAKTLLDALSKALNV